MISSLKPAILIGGNGFLGTAYRRYWQAKGQPVIWTSHYPHKESVYLNLEQPGSLPWQNWFKAGYRTVLFAAALTSVDLCERSPDAAYQINLLGPLELAKEAQNFGFRSVFCSSDYVFNGQRGDYTEADAVHPINIYGRYKALLEAEASQLENALIIRLTKLYDLELQGNSFIVGMAQDLLAGLTIQAASDQFFNPLYVGDFLRVLAALLSQEVVGLIHLGGPNCLSRLALARQIELALDISNPQVEPVALNELKLEAKRPLNTCLRSLRLSHYYSQPLLSIPEAIASVASALRASAQSDSRF